jgi:RNA polymerase sigma-70 factor (ECF subfamily)
LGVDARDAIELLFRSYERELGRYLVQMVRSPRICSRRRSTTLFAHVANLRVCDPRAWLYGIARNRALRALRSERRFQRALRRLGRGASEASGGDEELVAVQDLLERHLSPDARALMLLRYVHGFEAAELAEMTGLTAEAVRQRLARARARLLAAAQPTSGEGERR